MTDAETPTRMRGGLPVHLALAIGNVAGALVLIAQPAVGLPSLRIGPAPLLAGAVGAVAGQSYLMVVESREEAFADLWDDLAVVEDGDQE